MREVTRLRRSALRCAELRERCRYFTSPPAIVLGGKEKATVTRQDVGDADEVQLRMESTGISVLLRNWLSDLGDRGPHIEALI